MEVKKKGALCLKKLALNTIVAVVKRSRVKQRAGKTTSLHHGSLEPANRFKGVMVLGEEAFIDDMLNRVMNKKDTPDEMQLVGVILELLNEFKLPPIPLSICTESAIPAGFSTAMDQKAQSLQKFVKKIENTRLFLALERLVSDLCGSTIASQVSSASLSIIDRKTTSKLLESCLQCLATLVVIVCRDQSQKWTEFIDRYLGLDAHKLASGRTIWNAKTDHVRPVLLVKLIESGGLPAVNAIIKKNEVGIINLWLKHSIDVKAYFEMEDLIISTQFGSDKIAHDAASPLAMSTDVYSTLFSWLSTTFRARPHALEAETVTQSECDLTGFLENEPKLTDEQMANFGFADSEVAFQLQHRFATFTALCQHIREKYQDVLEAPNNFKLRSTFVEKFRKCFASVRSVLTESFKQIKDWRSRHLLSEAGHNVATLYVDFSFATIRCMLQHLPVPIFEDMNVFCPYEMIQGAGLEFLNPSAPSKYSPPGMGEDMDLYFKDACLFLSVHVVRFIAKRTYSTKYRTLLMTILENVLLHSPGSDPRALDIVCDGMFAISQAHAKSHGHRCPFSDCGFLWSSEWSERHREDVEKEEKTNFKPFRKFVYRSCIPATLKMGFTFQSASSVLKFFKHMLDRQASLLCHSDLCDEVHCILVVVCNCILMPEVMHSWLESNPLLPSAFFNFGLSIIKICAKVPNIHPSQWLFGTKTSNEANSEYEELEGLLKLFFEFELSIIAKAESGTCTHSNITMKSLLMAIQKYTERSEFLPDLKDMPNDISFSRFLIMENDVEAPHRAVNAAKVLGMVLNQFSAPTAVVQHAKMPEIKENQEVMQVSRKLDL
jgi:hypothetical protein